MSANKVLTDIAYAHWRFKKGLLAFFILFHYVSKNLYPMAIPNNFYKSLSSNKNCSISSENSLQSIFKTIAISFLILSGKGRWPSKN